MVYTNRFPKLYKRNKNKSIQEWRIEVKGDSYSTIYGVVDGVIQFSDWTKCKGKNIGKANETSPEEQALKEADAIMAKKLDQGFYKDITEIDNVPFFPMLAKKYVDRKKSINFKKTRVFVQPKLDGIRCTTSADGTFSRANNKFNSVPHIETALETFFNKIADIRLDGELYADEYKDNFNEICSIIKKQDPSRDDLKKSELTIKYFVYDYYGSKANFSDRIENLKVILPNNKNLVLVPTYEVSSHEEIEQYLEKFLEEGYEGAMVRLDLPYEVGKSSSLLKYKKFTDAEFAILDIQEGVGSRVGLATSLIFKAENGKEFASTPIGSFDYCRDLYQNKDKYIGKHATVKYFNLTPAGVPRFSKVIAIRDYE
jgi:DNA ligase 1